MLLLQQATNYIFTGNDPWIWANNVENGLGNRLGIPHGVMTRADVREFCRNLNNSDEACFVVIAAWGKMKVNHGRNTWLARHHWLPALRKIRHQNVPRQEAYQLFRDLRANDRLPGMGPAYFTKLIYFSRLLPDGYIMDQWTGKSIRLLGQLARGEQIVPFMTYQGFVSDDNTAEHYELFNTQIETLANHLGVTADECEMRLFSNGGHRRGPWRRYVRENWA